MGDISKVIDTWENLHDWLLVSARVKTTYALEFYDMAILKPTLGKIYTFWCMDGLGQNQDVDILWWAIWGELKRTGMDDMI